MKGFLPLEGNVENCARLLCKLVLVLAVPVLISSCAAQPGDQVPGANFAGDGENAIECRYRIVTGSNIPKRDCRRKQIWEAVDELERRTVDEYKRQTTESSGIQVGPGGPTQPNWDQ